MALAAICFDLDDTLHDLAGAQRDAVAVAAVHAARLWPGLRPEALAERYFALEGQAWEEYMAGTLDTSHYRRALFARPLTELLGREPEEEALADIHALRMREMDRSWRAFPDAIECLARLEGRFTLACLTNGPADNKWVRVAATGLDRFFSPERVFVSEAVGWHKPDRRYFDHVLAVLGLRPEQALMVGDNPATDIAGAQGVGMPAAWLNRTGNAWPGTLPPPAYELRSLSELPPLLGL